MDGEDFNATKLISPKCFPIQFFYRQANGGRIWAPLLMWQAKLLFKKIKNEGNKIFLPTASFCHFSLLAPLQPATCYQLLNSSARPAHLHHLLRRTTSPCDHFPKRYSGTHFQFYLIASFEINFHLLCIKGMWLCLFSTQ